MVRFLAWLAATAASGEVTEMAAADKLDHASPTRRSIIAAPAFRPFPGRGRTAPSFITVRRRETNRRLEAGQLYLVDSGGQYLDGTTDVTRTVAIGTPGEEERRRFTLVLKGHIALAACRFPAGTTGSQLDSLARRALWAEGLDYDHGTGHGVGSYLSVHEGPQRISETAERAGPCSPA